MKTKQIKFLSFLAVLLALSCSTEELQLDSNKESEVLLKKDGNDNLLNENDFNEQNKSLPEIQSNSNENDPVPLNDVYFLYIDIDATEADYNSNPNNPDYTGPFNIFYQNLMSNHFTIYSVVESTNVSCGNIERWIVDLEEFNQYLISIGLPEVDINGDDWYWHDDNLNGGDTSTTMLDVNGKRVKGTPPPPPPPPNVPQWLINHNSCFTI